MPPGPSFATSLPPPLIVAEPAGCDEQGYCGKNLDMKFHQFLLIFLFDQMTKITKTTIYLKWPQK